MSEYRHATNLRIPLDRTDINLLAIMQDYRLGRPIALDSEKVPTALTAEQMKANGVVGLYIKPEIFQDALFRATTGWRNPAMLGVPWEPI